MHEKVVVLQTEGSDYNITQSKFSGEKNSGCWKFVEQPPPTA